MQSIPRILFAGALALVGAFGCGEPAGDAARDPFLVKAGIMEPTDTGVRLQETRTVTMDPTRRPGWCFVVAPPDDQTYEVYSVSYLPGAPRQLTGETIDQFETSAGVRSATSSADGIHPSCFNFDPGDPLGEYRVEVFINGVRHSELRMQVVE